jgi:hypothetical protein
MSEWMQIIWLRVAMLASIHSSAVQPKSEVGWGCAGVRWGGVRHEEKGKGGRAYCPQERGARAGKQQRPGLISALPRPPQFPPSQPVMGRRVPCPCVDRAYPCPAPAPRRPDPSSRGRHAQSPGLWLPTAAGASLPATDPPSGPPSGEVALPCPRPWQAGPLAKRQAHPCPGLPPLSLACGCPPAAGRWSGPWRCQRGRSLRARTHVAGASGARAMPVQATGGVGVPLGRPGMMPRPPSCMAGALGARACTGHRPGPARRACTS